MTLHLTKVAVGCADIAALTERQTRYAVVPGEVRNLTRFMPKRAAELVGGSIFWIIKHRLVARQAIIGLDMVSTDQGEKCAIRLVPGPVPVLGTPKRAHQGWRYFEAADAPRDLAAGDADLDEVPALMLRELQALWLV
ncbi:DUF1489 domain-containing protein [Glacieibacterium sp.]|uniref:DUF1489 domain-containing protein n=1 Tax=Glacieibacterium sp. TaxID=2860237 RepID=UPI003B002767